ITYGLNRFLNLMLSRIPSPSGSKGVILNIPTGWGGGMMTLSSSFLLNTDRSHASSSSLSLMLLIPYDSFEYRAVKRYTSSLICRFAEALYFNHLTYNQMWVLPISCTKVIIQARPYFDLIAFVVN